jgi:hypothetical protein
MRLRGCMCSASSGIIEKFVNGGDFAVRDLYYVREI